MRVGTLDVAENVFTSVAIDHSERLLVVAGFLLENPELAPKARRGSAFGDQQYWASLAEKFSRARAPRSPREPSTIPDNLVSVILQEYFEFDKQDTARVAKEHRLSMAAENIVGDLLERYIASELEPYGWVWCSGEVIKKVDFLAAKADESGKWVPLQVKNRDNSENSSSSSVRDGTAIVKWFRTFSKTGKTNWDAFPENLEQVTLSESGFESFAREHLRAMRS